MSRPKRGYMDGIDFEDELSVAAGGTVVYPSVSNLKESIKHDVSECGIAEVEVSLVRWVEEPASVAEIVERHKRSVGEEVVGSLKGALAVAEEEAEGQLISTEGFPGVLHADHGTVVQPDQAAILVNKDEEVELLWPDMPDDEEVPPLMVLLAAVIVRSRDEEWVAEQMDYFENLD